MGDDRSELKFLGMVPGPGFTATQDSSQFECLVRTGMPDVGLYCKHQHIPLTVTVTRPKKTVIFY